MCLKFDISKIGNTTLRQCRFAAACFVYFLKIWEILFLANPFVSDHEPKRGSFFRSITVAPKTTQFSTDYFRCFTPEVFSRRYSMLWRAINTRNSCVRNNPKTSPNPVKVQVPANNCIHATDSPHTLMTSSSFASCGTVICIITTIVMNRNR